MARKSLGESGCLQCNITWFTKGHKQPPHMASLFLINIRIGVGSTLMNEGHLLSVLSSRPAALT